MRCDGCWYGETVPPEHVHDGDGAGYPVVFHHVVIGGLRERTTYYFAVESGGTRDDNHGRYYRFTTPVEQVAFDVRAVEYREGGMQVLALNVVNQDSRAYDSMELRIYLRGTVEEMADFGAAVDITLFAGTPLCDTCYGCDYSHHRFYVEVSGGQRHRSALALRTEAGEAFDGRARIDTTRVVVVGDPDRAGCAVLRIRGWEFASDSVLVLRVDAAGERRTGGGMRLSVVVGGAVETLQAADSAAPVLVRAVWKPGIKQKNDWLIAVFSEPVAVPGMSVPVVVTARAARVSFRYCR